MSNNDTKNFIDRGKKHVLRKQVGRYILIALGLIVLDIVLNFLLIRTGFVYSIVRNTEIAGILASCVIVIITKTAEFYLNRRFTFNVSSSALYKPVLYVLLAVGLFFLREWVTSRGLQSIYGDNPKSVNLGVEAAVFGGLGLVDFILCFIVLYLMFTGQSNSQGNKGHVGSVANQNVFTQHIPTGNESLDKMLKACAMYAGTDKEVAFTQIAADRLLKGEDGLPQDYDLAMKLFVHLKELNPARGLVGIGRVMMVKGLDENDKFTFTLGLSEVYEAYKLGSDDARDILQDAVEMKTFENVSTFDELVRFMESTHKR